MKVGEVATPRRDSTQYASTVESKWFPRVRLLAFACYGGLVVTAMVTLDFEWLLPVIQIPILFVVTKWIARQISQRHRDASIYGLLLAAFEFKMTGTLLRTAINDLVFNGMSDAREYNFYGKLVSSSFRAFDFNVRVGKVEGTGFMRLAAGVVYSFWGNSELGASLFFSWLAFLGMVLLWLAFRNTVSRNQSRRYGYLLFFIPSMIYWPSALGKDALSIFFIGLASYGLSCLINARLLSGAVTLVAGTYGLIYLRPHIALTVFAGALFAIAFWKSKRNTGRSGILRIVLFCGFALMLMIVIGRTEQFFGVSKLDPESVSQTLDSTTARTGEAGSSFTPIRMTNPVTFFPALASVLYRPLPFETSNFVGLLAGAEDLFLIVVTFRSRKRLANLFRAFREYVYPAYAMGMTLAFAFAFSSFSNFGILVRQRTQMLPLFLVLLCIPTRAEMTEELAVEQAEQLGLPEPAAAPAANPPAAVLASQTVSAGVVAEPQAAGGPQASVNRGGPFEWVANDARYDFGAAVQPRPAPPDDRAREDRRELPDDEVPDRDEAPRRGDARVPGARDHAPAPEPVDVPMRLPALAFGTQPEREFTERVPSGTAFKLVVSVGADGGPSTPPDDLVGDVSVPEGPAGHDIPFDLRVSEAGQAEFELGPEAVGMIARSGGWAVCRGFVIRGHRPLLLFAVKLVVDGPPDRGDM